VRNKIEFDQKLCQNLIKPTLQVLYQRYCAINDTQRQVDQMNKDRTWKGPTLTKTEIVNVFVARTTWFNFYHIQFKEAEKKDDMNAWLTEADDAPSDADLWGEAKDHYTLTDLDNWVTKRVGKKPQVVKKVAGKAQVVKKVAGKASVKGKGNVNASQSTDKGKGKEKQVVPKPVKSHKKKPTTG
jgi:hypothetical protein